MKEQVARLLAKQDGYEWEDLQTDYTDMYYRIAEEICELFKPKGAAGKIEGTWDKLSEREEYLIQQAKAEEREKVLNEIKAGAVSVADLIEKARSEAAREIVEAIEEFSHEEQSITERKC